MSCDSHGGSNINLGVESLIPLVVGRGILMKTVEQQLLFVNYGKGILIRRLCQNHLLSDADQL